MEPTQVKPTSSTLPVLPNPLQPEAYQRAPTLTAGQSAGDQGEVRVRAPDKKLVWNPVRYQVMTLGILALFWIEVLLVSHGSSVSLTIGGPFLGVLSGLVVALLMVVRSLRRPAYFTTDSAGIGITTSTGSLALHWTDIVSVEHVKQFRYSTLRMRTPEQIDIRLLGYPPEVQEELVSLVVSKAKLQPSSGKAFLFVRAAVQLSSPEVSDQQSVISYQSMRCHPMQ